MKSFPYFIAGVIGITRISAFIVLNSNNIFNHPLRYDANKLKPLKLTKDGNNQETAEAGAALIQGDMDEHEQAYLDVNDELQPLELWLDLRKTTISPQAALLHLTNDLWDEYLAPSNKSFLVDRVLVNELDETGMKIILNDISEEYEEEIIAMFINSNGCVKSIRQSSDNKAEGGEDLQTINEGNMFKIYNNEKRLLSLYVNPMPAIDIISSGQWLILDSEGIHEEDQRNEAIRSLVELCDGNFSMSNMALEKSFNSGKSSGGIVIDCTTSGDVVQAGALIKSLSGISGSYETTKSGILVQKPMKESESSTMLPFKNGESSMKYAVLIPFDALLWKTASFVFGRDGLDEDV